MRHTHSRSSTKSVLFYLMYVYKCTWKVMHRIVYTGVLQGAYRRELLFAINPYHFTSIYCFCNLNRLLTRIYLGMVKKRKGRGGREVEKEKRNGLPEAKVEDWIRVIAG